MADSKAKITAEMQAEDNYRKSLNADAACVWKKNSGKTLPKKVRDSKRYKCRYNAHTKALKHAFESGVFEVKHEEGIGFGVFALKDLSPANAEDKREVKRLWACAQACTRHHGGDGLCIERRVTIKKKGRPCKDGTKEVPGYAYKPFALVGPLDFVNHGCDEHINMSWRCARDLTYEPTLKKEVKAGEQLIINYYADKTDDDLPCCVCGKVQK